MVSTVSKPTTFNRLLSMALEGRYKVLVTHPEIPEKAINLLKEKGYEVKISKNAAGAPAPSRSILLEDIRGMHGVLWCGHILVDQEMIEAAGSQLKVVGVMSAGYDHISVGLLYERGIRVTNSPGVLSSAVADMAVGLALAVSRNIVKGVDIVKQGLWVTFNPVWMCGPTLEGATVGVVGLGNIGAKIVQRIKAFDVKEILYYNRRKKPDDEENGAQYTSLDELLKRSDFVFLVVPANKDSIHLIDMDKLKKMKKTAILINSARGNVVNQNDLIAALKEGIIGGAGLDVTDPEPLPTDSELLKMDNVVVTPHISSATFRARENMAVLAARNIVNVLQGGEPITPIPRPTN